MTINNDRHYQSDFFNLALSQTRIYTRIFLKAKILNSPIDSAALDELALQH